MWSIDNAKGLLEYKRLEYKSKILDFISRKQFYDRKKESHRLV